MIKCILKKLFTMADRLEKSEAKNKYGNTLYELHQYSNAIFAYTDAINLCPQIAKYYSNRSACYLMLNDYLKALSDARKAIELDKGYKKAYIRIGNCCIANGDMKYAENVLTRAKGIFHGDENITKMYNLIKHIQKNLEQYEIHMEHKKYEEALKYIDICLRDAPTCTRYLSNKGRCLIYLQRFSEAEIIADSILKYNSTDEDAIYIKLSVEIYQEDIKKSTELSKELKKKLPDHSATAKLYRSSTLIQKNDQEIKKAIEQKDYLLAYDLLSKTIKIDENRKMFNKRLYIQKIAIAGKNEKLLWNGIEDCTSFMEIYKNDKDIREILKVRAEYYLTLQEYEDAIEDYNEIMIFDKSNDLKTKLETAKELLEDQLKHDHKILKISEKATKDDIKKASNELFKRYHPDKNNKATSTRKKILEQKVIRVRKAVENLLKAHN